MNLKKFMIIFGCVLAAAILIALIFLPGKDSSSTVTFYYARSNFAYGEPNGAIGSEQRSVGGHEDDLNYLLALYLEGPLDENLSSPLPGKHYVRILDLSQKGDALHIKLSDLSSVMTDSQFTLAAACLTKTCMGMHNVQAVQIDSGSRSIRMNHANLQFYDESSSVVYEKTEERK